MFTFCRFRLYGLLSLSVGQRPLAEAPDMGSLGGSDARLVAWIHWSRLEVGASRVWRVAFARGA